ncbi:MAG: histidine phosphatase family protein [Deinococcus sp.]|uniref:histidine phosphatase family protein n=1 Tax=Deinococcus sp. TaxID=47478 RepID=UPI0026DB57B5|nr:histidine phosphatase family protein [Deinococcus sp.]MDO4246587.1 histidine phosphatase family protein [Deinococcus sp.]
MSTGDAGAARLILVRHGETDHNKSRRVQGHIDIPLNGEGQRQARRLGQHLRELGVQSPTIHASDLTRAQATAQALQAEVGGTLATFPALREIFLGDWEGHLYDDLAERDPIHPRFWSGDPDVRPPRGETVRDVMTRTEAHLQGHWPAAGETLVLVSHGIAISALLTRLLGLDYQTEFQSRRYMHLNTAYSLLDVDPVTRQVIRAELAQSPHLVGASGG